MNDRTSEWGLCESAPLAAPTSFGTSRRTLLGGATLALVSWMTSRTALAQVTVGPDRESRVLVVLFMRGGCDGLSMVAPHGDDDYHRARPNLALAKRDLVAPGEMFGFHPSLRPLESLYREGKLAAIHAVGSQDATRSHFEAMDTMERGVADRVGPSTGWVARYLEAGEPQSSSPLRAVAFGTTSPTSLLGATDAVTLSSLSDFQLRADAKHRQTLRKLYEAGDDPISHSGRETLQVLDTLEKLDPARQTPRNGAKYPDTGMANGMRQVATLLRANVGLEIACLDMGGFDTHVAQGTTTGWLAGLLTEVGEAMAAFAQDLGKDMDRVNVVVMSEFGRRIAENTGLGTDHGHGGAMLVMGGGVQGGKVHANWPGLKEGVGPGDLAVTTDYRDVLSEALARLSPVDPQRVFPNHRPQRLGLIKPS